MNEAQNIVATLRGAGFGTLFVSTAEYHPFVPVPRDWTRVIGMRDLQQREGWVAVTGSKVEAGVEDRAALPAIADFVSSHSRTLVMHEMLFGHSPRWIAKTGKSQLEYYDAYLLELVRDLQQQELLDRTLLVVVSDHGDRADSFDVENYRVPLLVSGRGIPPSKTSDHFCHTDFQRILGHFLAGRQPPKPSESFLTVGSTERWVYGEIAARGGYLFIDNDSGAVVSSHGGLDARSVFDRFQNQLNVFAARHQR